MTNRAKLYEYENCDISNDAILFVMNHFPDVPDDKISELLQEWQDLHKSDNIIETLKNSVDDCSLVSDYLFPLLFFKYLMNKKFTKDLSGKNIWLMSTRYQNLVGLL